MVNLVAGRDLAKNMFPTKNLSIWIAKHKDMKEIILIDSNGGRERKVHIEIRKNPGQGTKEIKIHGDVIRETISIQSFKDLDPLRGENELMRNKLRATESNKYGKFHESE